MKKMAMNTNGKTGNNFGTKQLLVTDFHVKLKTTRFHRDLVVFVLDIHNKHLSNENKILLKNITISQL